MCVFPITKLKRNANGSCDQGDTATSTAKTDIKQNGIALTVFEGRVSIKDDSFWKIVTVQNDIVT